LTDKQMRKAKWAILLGAIVATVNIGTWYLSEVDAGVTPPAYTEEDPAK